MRPPSSADQANETDYSEQDAGDQAQSDQRRSSRISQPYDQDSYARDLEQHHVPHDSGKVPKYPPVVIHLPEHLSPTLGCGNSEGGTSSIGGIPDTDGNFRASIPFSNLTMQEGRAPRPGACPAGNREAPRANAVRTK